MAVDQHCAECGGDLLRGPCTASHPKPHGEQLRQSRSIVELLERADASDLVQLLPAVLQRRVVRRAEEGGTLEADDDKREPYEWCIDARVRLEQADAAADGDLGRWRERMLRVAELALAGVASFDRRTDWSHG